MVLAKDEKVVKEWEYSSAGSVSEVSRSVLTITNKRVISSIKSKNKIEQNEIPLSSVKGVSCQYGTYAKWLSILLVVLGGLALIFAIAAFAVSMAADPESADYGVDLIMGYLMGTICLVIAIPCLFMGIVRLLSGLFNVVITITGTEGTSLAFGALGLFGGALKRKGSLIVKVNSEKAKEIVDSLGAVLLDTKE